MRILRIKTLEGQLERLKKRETVTSRQFELVVLELLFELKRAGEWKKLRDLAEFSLRYYKQLGVYENSDFRCGIYPIYSLMFGLGLIRADDDWGLGEQFIKDAMMYSQGGYLEASFEYSVELEKRGDIQRASEILVYLMSMRFGSPIETNLNVWSNSNDLYSEKFVIGVVREFSLKHYGDEMKMLEKFKEAAEKFKQENKIEEEVKKD